MQFLLRARRLGPGLPQVLASEALTWLGLLMGHIAVMWWVAQEGGARDLAVFGIAVAVISLVAAPWLAPLGDKFPKRTMRVLAIGLFCAEALVLGLLAWNGTYNLPALIALEALALGANTIFVPVSSTQLTELAASDRLSEAFALQKSAQSAGRLAGPGVAGMLLSTSGTATTLLVQAVVLGAAAILAAAAPWHKAAAPSQGRRSWLADMREGLRASMAVPLERNWTLVTFLSSLFLFPVLNMLVPLKVQSLQLSGTWFGWCEAMLSLGMLLSALKGTEFVVRHLGRHRARIAASTMLALSLAAFGAGSGRFALLASFFLAGFAQSTLVLVGITHRTLARPAHVRARMAATAGMSVDFAYVISPALAAYALTQAPVAAVYVVFAICGALFALAVSWLPGMKRLLQLDHTEVEGWYAKVSPEAFQCKPGEAEPAPGGPLDMRRELTSQYSASDLRDELARKQPVVYAVNGNRAVDGEAFLARIEQIAPLVGITRVADISRLSPTPFPVSRLLLAGVLGDLPDSTRWKSVTPDCPLHCAGVGRFIRDSRAGNGKIAGPARKAACRRRTERPALPIRRTGRAAPWMPMFPAGREPKISRN